jgi:hypothetical protein
VRSRTLRDHAHDERRHYFEVELGDGAVAVVYFERQAKRGAPRWFLYTLDEGEKPSTRTKNA